MLNIINILIIYFFHIIVNTLVKIWHYIQKIAFPFVASNYLKKLNLCNCAKLRRAFFTCMYNFSFKAQVIFTIYPNSAIISYII